jgi:hypothetical protein
MAVVVEMLTRGVKERFSLGTVQCSVGAPWLQVSAVLMCHRRAGPERKVAVLVPMYEESGASALL